MKQFRKFVFPTFVFILVTVCCLGQKKDYNKMADPATILWKITGPQCPKPSYIIGTMHLADAGWLLKYPEITKVIDSTKFILSEAFTTKPAVQKVARRHLLKAVPLLDRNQFVMLDSFFVAKVGEGIRNNKDAEDMTVAEMKSIILTTLVADSTKPNGVTRFIDKQLFDLYVTLGREGDNLDIPEKSDFDSSEVDLAKKYIAKTIKYVEHSDKPDWNIYQMKNLDKTIAQYKQMSVEYSLDVSTAETKPSDNPDFIPMEQRNKNWMPKITARISSQPTLIAVGQAHLRYKTGIIMLLRGQGYTVEPVMMKKH